MNLVLRFRLGDLLVGPATCSHLDEDEVIGLAEGRLNAERLTRFGQHAEDCDSCTELLDDLKTFQGLTTHGITIASERKAYEKSAARIRQSLPRARTLASFRSVLLWLTPAVAAAIVIALLTWIPDGRMIAEIGTVPLVPPPTVRAADMMEKWQKLDVAWSEDDMPLAAGLLEEAVVESPEDTSLWFYLGYARLRIGDDSGAVEALQQADALQAEAPSAQTRFMLAAALERVGRRDEACDALRSVEEIGGSRGQEAGEIVKRSCP